MERREVPIVSAQSSRELPCALDCVELGAVRREENKREIFLTLFPPFFVQSGVVETSVVEDDHHLPM